MHDAGMVEARQGAGLVEKPAQSVVKHLRHVRRLRREGGVPGGAHGDALRAVLLDGDLALEAGVETQIGHAESARADDAADLEAFDGGAGGERLLPVAGHALLAACAEPPVSHIDVAAGNATEWTGGFGLGP